MSAVAHRSPVRRVAALGRPHAMRLAVAAVAGALAVGAGIALVATSGYLISHAAQRPPILALGVVIVMVRFFAISRAVLRYLERLAGHDAALRVLGSLRAQLFARLEPLVPGGLSGVRTGDLLSRFVADVDELQELWLRVLGPFAVAVLAGVGSVVAAALISPPAALPLAAALAVGAIVVPALGTLAARRAASREAPAQAELAAELVEALRLAPELAAFGAADLAAARIAAADRVLSRHRRRTALTIAAAEGCTTALAGLATVAVLLVAIPAVVADAMPGVLLGALALLALASFEAVRPLPAAAAELSRTQAAARRVLELTDREPPVRDPDAPAGRTPTGRLELRDVAARYGDDQPWVLDGVDLALAPGEVVALVGESGTGKSTLAHLAVRFRDPDRGAVLLDGCDLRRLDQESVRREVVLAGQEAHLFATSIRENLRIGRPGADDDELRDALTRAHVDDFVARLPDGLDTMVGEDGAHVSGGQRQRLALARALLARPRFLILDEPDAHLDDEVADVLVPELVEAAREAGLGVLVITHRRSAAGAADRIVELGGGRLGAAD